jgi:hypothetical protein
METENQKIGVHQGATELEQLKLTMLRTVLRRGMITISVLGLAYLVLSLCWTMLRGG